MSEIASESTGRGATNPALLQAVLAAPDELGPRLVLADWLMQQGDPRGDFIQAQCRLSERGLSPSARKHLIRRAGVLLDEHGRAWAAPARSIARSWEFRLGFIHKIAGAAAKVLDGWQPLWDSEPVLALELERADSKLLAHLARSPLLGRVRHLSVRGPVGDAGADALAASPHLGALVRLNLRDTGVGDDGVRSLAGAMQCRSLVLTGNDDITDDAAEALAGAPALASMHELYLSRTGLTDQGVTALAGSPHVQNLTMLALGSLEELTDDGARALIDSPSLTSLKRLDIGGCYELSSKMIKALRKRFARVRA